MPNYVPGMFLPRSGFLLRSSLCLRLQRKPRVEYLDAVEKVEPEVEDLASRIVDNLNIDVSSPDA